MNTGNAMGGHQSARPITTTWLTPPHIIQALGKFDLDPCGFAGSPIPCADVSICEPDDGLAAEWFGRAFVNPPYTTGEIDQWLRKLAIHGQGTALIFARTETACFAEQVFGRASGLLFLAGRLHFHHPDGTRAKANAGAPSVLCAYGQDDLDRLAACNLPGTLTPLRFARFLVVGAMEQTWRDLVLSHVRAHDGPVVVSDLYRAIARHPNTRRNVNWRAKVRQTLQRHCERVGPAMWTEAAA
jgi:hypothetical protein